MIDKRKIFIILGVFVGIVIIISVVIFIIQRSNADKNNTKVKDDSLSSAYVDPYSGETVYDQKSRTPEAYNKSQDATIIFLGFTELINYGLTSSQLQYIQSDITTFSQESEQKINEITIDKATLKQTINSDTGEKSISFTGVANRSESNRYAIQILYTSINEARTIISKGGTTVYDTADHSDHDGVGND